MEGDGWDVRLGDGVAQVQQGEQLQEVGDRVLGHLLVEPQAAEQGSGDLTVL